MKNETAAYVMVIKTKHCISIQTKLMKTTEFPPNENWRTMRLQVETKATKKTKCISQSPIIIMRGGLMRNDFNQQAGQTLDSFARMKPKSKLENNENQGLVSIRICLNGI